MELLAALARAAGFVDHAQYHAGLLADGDQAVDELVVRNTLDAIESAQRQLDQVREQLTHQPA